MSEHKPTSPDVPSTAGGGQASTGSMDMLMLTYILMALGLVMPVVSIAGVVVAYMNRDGVMGTWRESHYTWLIRTFWIALAVGIVAVITMIVAIGFVLALALFVWAVIRLAKGWMAYSKQQPIAKPEDWMFG
jgi:uncharacterized membrane protein